MFHKIIKAAVSPHDEITFTVLTITNCGTIQNVDENFVKIFDYQDPQQSTETLVHTHVIGQALDTLFASQFRGEKPPFRKH